jgi:hypothetical protein
MEKICNSNKDEISLGFAQNILYVTIIPQARPLQRVFLLQNIIFIFYNGNSEKLLSSDLSCGTLCCTAPNTKWDVQAV